MADSAPSRADTDADRLRALDRLRDRVEKAAREIERLRTENAELRARVQDLAAHDAVEGDTGAALALGDDPEAVRAQIEDFIGAIDRLLTEPADESADAS